MQSVRTEHCIETLHQVKVPATGNSDLRGSTIDYSGLIVHVHISYFVVSEKQF